MAENPMFTAPMAAALRHLPPPPPPDPLAPGPFAFADPERVRRILAEAGFQATDIRPLDVEISPGSPEQGLVVAQRIGPVGQMLRENPQVRDAVVADLHEAMGARVREGQVRFDSATWVVTAAAPG